MPLPSLQPCPHDRRRGRTGTRPLLAATVTGTALGLTTSLANVLGSPYTPHRISPDGVWLLQLLGAVLGSTWAWAAAGFCCGWWARRWWHAPALAVVGLWCADVVYYVSDYLGGLDDALSTGEMGLYAVLATGLGLVMGLLAGWARHAVRWSLLPALAATIVLMAVQQRSGVEVVADASRTTQTALTIAFLAALTIRWHRTRPRTRGDGRDGLPAGRVVG